MKQKLGGVLLLRVDGEEAPNSMPTFFCLSFVPTRSFPSLVVWIGLDFPYKKTRATPPPLISMENYQIHRESEVTVHLTESGFISFCVLLEFVAPETSFENHLRSASAMSITMFCS